MKPTLLTMPMAAAVFILAPPAFAQSACSFPACNLEGERYDASMRECRSGPDAITRAESHRPATCLAGERLDTATGQCVLEACDDGGCEVRRLCNSKERYARSGSDREGPYGVCESGPADFTLAKSHRLVRCPTGFTLNTARGVCVGNCRPSTVRPDLVIRRAFLRPASGGAPVTRVRRGQPYYACFEVANVGAAASGPFRVGGGGLGVPVPPGQNHASLLPGRSREGCLSYSTTPPVGSYRLELRADSLDRVTESREGNNTATLAVTVIP